MRASDKDYTAGMSAMLAFDPDADFNTNRIEMTNALERVATGQVTFAARDSDYEGHAIKQGEILCIENGKLSFVERTFQRQLTSSQRSLLRVTAHSSRSFTAQTLQTRRLRHCKSR